MINPFRMSPNDGLRLELKELKRELEAADKESEIYHEVFERANRRRASLIAEMEIVQEVLDKLSPSLLISLQSQRDKAAKKGYS